MTDRKTITINTQVYEDLEASKPPDTTWSDFLRKLADGSLNELNEPSISDDVLTEAHIDDIGAEVERRFERVIANRRTGR